MSECCAGLENWFPLQKANKDLEIQGEILLEYGIRTSEATGQSHLFVTVVEGRSVIVEGCHEDGGGDRSYMPCLWATKGEPRRGPWPPCFIARSSHCLPVY